MNMILIGCTNLLDKHYLFDTCFDLVKGLSDLQIILSASFVKYLTLLFRLQQEISKCVVNEISYLDQ